MFVDTSGTAVPLFTGAASTPGRPSHAGAGRTLHSVMPRVFPSVAWAADLSPSGLPCPVRSRATHKLSGTVYLPQTWGGGGGAGMHWTEGRLPPPLQGAQPIPSHCPPDAKCQLQWHL